MTRALPALGLLGALLLGSGGCMGPQTRGQKEEESDHDRYHVVTVGDKTTVGGAQPMQVSGVGLVVGLDGTGGEGGADGYRAMLMEELQKANYRNVKEMLRSPNNALVLVSAIIPPGAHKHERIDVDVTLPRGSKATNLRGGKLLLCNLRNYELAENLSPNASGLIPGHILVKAEGPILVDVGAQGEDNGQRQGRIWNGGRCLAEQPLLLITNDDQRQARMTNLIAERIKEVLSPGIRVGQAAGLPLAVAMDKVAVAIQVPAQYRLNVPHYLRVVRFVPLEEKGDGQRKGGVSYRHLLAEDLLDPAHTVAAALRLEALGTSSIPFLKKGLQGPHPLVRFCCAESLLYLGSAAGAEEVARAVTEQPLLRAFGLTALASLDESACQLKLGELVVRGREDETRYGAFRALQTLDDSNPAVRGELLNDSFWLHTVAPNTPPLIHVCTMKRAEIVMFGEEPFLRPPFALMAGEFTVTASEGDAHCMVSRVAHGSAQRREVSLKLRDVLTTMADLNALYPEVVQFIRQADRSDALTCRVRFDALPQAVPVEDLAKAGKEQIGEEGELVMPKEDLGATPTLYEIDKSPVISDNRTAPPSTPND
jgi:hypothetical protein